MYCDQVSYVSLYAYRRHERESFRKYREILGLLEY